MIFVNGRSIEILDNKTEVRIKISAFLIPSYWNNISSYTFLFLLSLCICTNGSSTVLLYLFKHESHMMTRLPDKHKVYDRSPVSIVLTMNKEHHRKTLCISKPWNKGS